MHAGTSSQYVRAYCPIVIKSASKPTHPGRSQLSQTRSGWLDDGHRRLSMLSLQHMPCCAGVGCKSGKKGACAYINETVLFQNAAHHSKDNCQQSPLQHQTMWNFAVCPSVWYDRPASKLDHLYRVNADSLKICQSSHVNCYWSH